MKIIKIVLLLIVFSNLYCSDYEYCSSSDRYWHDIVDKMSNHVVKELFKNMDMDSLMKNIDNEGELAEEKEEVADVYSQNQMSEVQHIDEPVVKEVKSQQCAICNFKQFHYLTKHISMLKKEIEYLVCHRGIWTNYWGVRKYLRKEDIPERLKSIFDTFCWIIEHKNCSILRPKNNRYIERNFHKKLYIAFNKLEATYFHFKDNDILEQDLLKKFRSNLDMLIIELVKIGNEYLKKSCIFVILQMPIQEKIRTLQEFEHQGVIL